MKKREMSCVKLYDDGDYAIESAPANYATGRLWFHENKGEGVLYYCPKGKERYYLKRLLNSQMKQARARLDKATADYQAMTALGEKITSGEEL